MKNISANIYSKKNLLSFLLPPNAKSNSDMLNKPKAETKMAIKVKCVLTIRLF